MHRMAAWAGAAAVVLSGGLAAGQAPPPPAPGSPGIYKSAAELAGALRAASPTTFGMTISPIADTDQYRVNIVHRPGAAGAIAHPGNTELHYIIDGAGTLVTGGTIVPAASPGSGATIHGGVTRHVAKGDVVIVPAGTPHWYREVGGEITYLEVRYVAPAK